MNTEDTSVIPFSEQQEPSLFEEQDGSVSGVAFQRLRFTTNDIRDGERSTCRQISSLSATTAIAGSMGKMTETPRLIEIGALHPHPGNPRLAPREDVVEQIAAQLNGKLDEAHALIVRPNGKGYEIISGHHRKLAAEKAGLSAVPCWVRDMSDEDAYMALALNNAQGELHPLEVGLHALHSGMSGSEYARRAGVPQTTLADRIKAAKVVNACALTHEIADRWRHLAEIHAAPKWLWGALVEAMLGESWTVENARKAVARFKDLTEPAPFADKDAVAVAVVTGAMKPGEVARFEAIYDRSVANISKGEEDAERLCRDLDDRIRQKRPGKLSELVEICNGVEAEQGELIRKRQQADLFRRKQEEEIRARTARLRRNVSLEEWNSLSAEERASLLPPETDGAPIPSFNRQTGPAIEWAQWSWNPVTGCWHDCPYCYARDEALSARQANNYPNGFEPTFRPMSLHAPAQMTVPKEAARDTRFKNVFTCSMADLFGRWVPAEWIESVLGAAKDAPQWNFLFLTKFPKRMSEFTIPDNAWMGTTVDLQARVAAAEAGFAKVKCGVRWLSIEPMIEPLRFNRLDLFDWIVIGGASSSAKTPEWRPPFEWVADLVRQARDAGTKVYFKTNLLGNRLLELPFDAPIKADPAEAPAVFHYLGRAKSSDQKPETA